MPKFRKKPIIIEAFQWTGGPEQTEDPDWIIDALVNGTAFFDIEVPHVMKIITLEGIMTVSRGDYIIQGVNGEIYPCRPDIFEKTYEHVED
jgi:hypothetical protein